jgi:hypothetical protein
LSVYSPHDVGEDVDAEELWLQEAERRCQEYRAGHIASKPVEQVFEDAKKDYNDTHRFSRPG